jgi:hypothetical protein
MQQVEPSVMPPVSRAAAATASVIERVDSVPLEWGAEVASPRVGPTDDDVFVTPILKSHVTPIDMVHTFEDADLDPDGALATPAWMKKRLSVRKAMARTPMSPVGRRPTARDIGEHPRLEMTYRIRICLL